jgi:hypothetical protein
MSAEIQPECPPNLPRDVRWTRLLVERGAGIDDGWIALVVGWAHVGPDGNHQRLPGLLVAQGFHVTSVRLYAE